MNPAAPFPRGAGSVIPMSMACVVEWWRRGPPVSLHASGPR
jgi:hypothetical protein